MTRSFTVINNTGGGGSNGDNGGGSTGNSSLAKFSISGVLIPVTGFAPDVTTTIPAQPMEDTYKSTGVLRLEIPSLSINKQIVGIQFKNKGWDVKWLEDSIGYLEGSAYPTWSGNSVLTGHATDANGNITSFGYIRELAVGEKIMIHSNGMIYIYQVKENRLILPSSIESLFKHQDYSWITLVTCENYNEDLGKYTSRRIVRAVLISVIPEN
jgi:LPXTG-site transpeptidase (sortase) family protein